MKSINNDINWYWCHVDDVHVSDHFKVSEFNTGRAPVIPISSLLIHILELIRKHFDKPIKVHSGYRTPEYNEQIGGAGQSRHMIGYAADISIKGIKPIDIARYAYKLGIRRIGIGRVFCHVDTDLNEGNSLAFWHYGQKNPPSAADVIQ